MQRKAIRAAQRRVGGGGVKGTAKDSDDEGGDMLDAGQIRVADILRKRLDDEIDLEYKEQPSPAFVSTNFKDQSHSSDDIIGVQLFRNGPATMDVVFKPDEGAFARRHKGPVSSSSDDDLNVEPRFLSVAIDADSLIDNAKKAAAAAKLNIALVGTVSGNEGGKAKQRKLRKEREAAVMLGAGQESNGGGSEVLLEKSSKKESKKTKTNKKDKAS